MRPRLLLLEPDAAFRLALIAALREAFDVSVPNRDDDLLRLARALRPDVALFAAGDRQRGEAMRLSRVLKTDVRSVPALGLYTHRGERGPSAAAVKDVAADGFLPSVVEPGALLPFAVALARGEVVLPNPWPDTAPLGLRRVLTRLLGRLGSSG